MATIAADVLVLGTGNDGTGHPTLVLSIERRGQYSSDVKVVRRYLFNVGECTQRVAGENRIKLNQLSSIFFTSASVEACSGLPGCIYTLSSIGVPKIAVVGPKRTSEVGLFTFVRLASFITR
jgi:ribonuclease BN (tRNA processing enzyme)